MRLLIAFAAFCSYCFSTPSFSMSCSDITLGPDHSVWEAVSAEFMKNSNAYTTSLLVKHVIQQKTNEGRDSLELLEKLRIELASYEHMLLISAEFPMQDYIDYVFAEENTELHQIFLKAGFRM